MMFNLVQESNPSRRLYESRRVPGDRPHPAVHGDETGLIYWRELPKAGYGG